MTMPLNEVCCASMPLESLTALAEVRCHPGVEAALDGGRAWVRWEPGDTAVLFRVLSVSGVRLYVRRGTHWYRHGRHLPAFDFPAHLDYRPLHDLLVPAPVEALPAPAVQPRPVPLMLTADPR